MNTQDYFDRIRNTEREHLVARRALEFCVSTHIRQTVAELRETTNLADAERCLKNLEATYTIRMFSDFEAALRDFWKYCMGRQTTPEMKRLIDAVAAKTGAGPATISEVHGVRQYRNDLIHNAKPKAKVLMQDNRHRLRAFPSYFPKGLWKLKIHP